MKHKLGIVIVNYVNYEDTIHYIYNDLLKQEDIEISVVIVENASPNNSFIKLEESFSGNNNVTIIKNTENKGYATGNNIGIKFLEQIGCEFILISNNDILLDDTYLLSKMVNRYNQLESPGFISPVMLVNQKISKEYSAWKLPTKTKEILSSSYFLKFLGYPYLQKFIYKINVGESKELKVDCLPGSFFLGKTSVFQEIGYFDENTFLYFEETILGFKIRSKHLQNYLLQYLTYHHYQEHSTNTIFSSKKKHLLLLNSKIYYWKQYHNSSIIFIMLLKLINKIHSTESFILKSLNKFYA